MANTLAVIKFAGIKHTSSRLLASALKVPHSEVLLAIHAIIDELAAVASKPQYKEIDGHQCIVLTGMQALCLLYRRNCSARPGARAEVTGLLQKEFNISPKDFRAHVRARAPANIYGMADDNTNPEAPVYVPDRPEVRDTRAPLEISVSKKRGLEFKEGVINGHAAELIDSLQVAHVFKKAHRQLFKVFLNTAKKLPQETGDELFKLDCYRPRPGNAKASALPMFFMTREGLRMIASRFRRAEDAAIMRKYPQIFRLAGEEASNNAERRQAKC